MCFKTKRIPHKKRLPGYSNPSQVQENSKDEDDKTTVDWVLEGRRCVDGAAMLVDLRGAVRHLVAV